ncbi:LytR/AlgR family response regulator transcription factor [Emticicia sp. SJ17W-69]|uniref:LytR/AlgR family response regulator transcription factor n=1 Tax=Emticicia sp. SJ17W-69 TaxID=3421657 RepID=UPI003EBBBE1B
MENTIPIGGFRWVKPNEIMLLQADINYTVIHFKDGEKFIVATPLKSLQARFEPFNFYRTHKSFMVNLEFVEHFLEPHKQLQMTNNKKVMVSRRKVNGLKKSLLNDR